MSFILEALKKSEAQRNRQAPGADQPLRIRRRPQSRRPLWPILLLVPLVAVLLVLVWWMGRDSGSARSVGSTVVQAPPDQVPGGGFAGHATGTPVNAAVKPAPVPRDLEQVASGSSLSAAPATTARVAAVEPPLAAVPIPVRHENNDRVAPEAQQPPDLRQTIPAADRIPEYSDLTADLQRRLAKPEISLHVYSAVPERRMVRVNGQLLRQGERLLSGLEIYEIKPELTVFRYSGQLFRLARGAE